MLAAVTLQGTVRPQIFLAMEVMGLSRDFVSLHCKKCGFTLDASKVYHWLRQGSGAARSWDEILTLLMPQGGGQDFSLGLLSQSPSQVMLPALIMLDGGCLHLSYS